MKAAATRTTPSRTTRAEGASEGFSLEKSSSGAIQIHEGVIASIARKAVLETEGVSRLAGNALIDNIAEIVGSRRMQSRAITVDLKESGQVSLMIRLNILFGYKLPVVAAQIQRAVTAQIEETTGMTVSSVDVLIQDIEEKSADTSAEESSEADPEK